MPANLNAPVRPRRSVLYMPGSNARAMEKAKSLPADGIIMDLEDAVALDSKETAREITAAAVLEGGYGRREVVIRINGLDTEWASADMAAAARAAPDAVLIPKVESGDDVRRAQDMMERAGAPETVALWAMMETPMAMLHAEDIAAAVKDTRLAVFVMGTNDLVKELRARHSPDRLPLITGLSLSLLAARAYGLDVIDGVQNAIDDMDLFVHSCRQGLEFGFNGKTLIHPSQIEPCNKIFTPHEDAVEWARMVIAEFKKPENASKGVVQVEGRMVERLHAEEAQHLVALADAIAALERDRANENGQG